MPRADSNTAIELQDRDVEILRGLFDSRLMTLAHITALHFDGRQESAKKRIQKLKAAELIGERKRKLYEPSILFLTREGYSLLNSRGHLADYPQITWANLEKRLQVSDLTLRHELEVMDVKAAFGAALQNNKTFALAEFSTWPRLFEFDASPDGRDQVLVKPDAFARIREHTADELFEHTFFIEVDRSTETLDTIAKKALCYLDYYRSGGLAVRAGRPKTEFKDYPFRVLLICKSEERKNNVAERLLAGNPPIFTQVWLATKQEVCDRPLEAIWLRPTDYRNGGSEADFPRRQLLEQNPEVGK